jgi:hypothetical protein
MKTRKPCPGCGQVIHGREAEKVCVDCRRAIDSWNKHIATIKAAPDQCMVLLKGVYHWYPMFYFGGPRCSIFELDEMRGELAEFFEELATRLCSHIVEWQDARGEKPEELFPVPDVRKPLKTGQNYAEPVGYPATHGESSYHDKTGLIDRRNLELLRGLWDRTARFTDLAYIAGLTDGRNLLLQLSSGALSVDDLQEHDVKVARDRQNAAYLHRKLKGTPKRTRQKPAANTDVVDAASTSKDL